MNGLLPWSGGAFDTKRDRLVLWGGGHNAYYGNELYAFNLQDFTWDRLTDPSAVNFPASNCLDVLSDGNPNSRHTVRGNLALAKTELTPSHVAFTANCS